MFRFGVLFLGVTGLSFLSPPAKGQGEGWQETSEKVERLIAKSRRLGGDAPARKARRLLDPWWELEEVPAKIRLQRATLLQRDHHFDEALTDLNQVLRQDPACPEAWLMKSTILTVAGRYEEARQAAVPLFGLTSPLLAVTAGTAPTSCHGSLGQSYQVLSGAVESHSEETPAVLCWAHTALAEMAVRLGKTDEAHEHFKAALLRDPSSPYLLKNYATFMLEAGDPEKALDLIRGSREFFPVVWMQARKAAGADPSELQALMEAYENDLREKNARHGHSHGRDEAIYFLEVKGDAGEARHHATANWESQREAADLLIVVKSALAADDEVTLASLKEWISERRFQDVRLEPLFKENN